MKVEFSLRGREWTSPKGEVRYFNSLETWSVDRVGDSAGAGAGSNSGSGPSESSGMFADGAPPPTDDDDIPF